MKIVIQCNREELRVAQRRPPKQGSGGRRKCQNYPLAVVSRRFLCLVWGVIFYWWTNNWSLHHYYSNSQKFTWQPLCEFVSQNIGVHHQSVVTHSEEWDNTEKIIFYGQLVLALGARPIQPTYWVLHVRSVSLLCMSYLNEAWTWL